MSDKSICVVVCAYKIQKDLVVNFLSMNKDTLENNKIGVCIVSELDSPVKESGMIRVVKYPIEQKVFNFSKTTNYGIRNSLDFDVIIKTDIDIYLTDSAIKKAIDFVDDQHGLVLHCAECQNVNLARGLEKTWPKSCKIIVNGYGAFFALHKSTWSVLNGYNEKLFGWGSEDRNMFDRARNVVSMLSSKDFPLFHLKHPKRIGSFFPYRSGENRNLCREGGYFNENWGIP